MSIIRVCYFARYICTILLITAESFVIVDIDECRSASHKCDPNANCANTVGSHRCSCKKGFTGDGRSCSGRNEIH